MTETIRRIFSLLNRKQRRKAYWLLPAITVMALLQVVGIASVLPFLTLVANPETIEGNSVFSWIYTTLNFGSETSFLVFAGLAALFILIVSNGFTTFTEWMMLRFSWQINHTLSSRVLSDYLHKPYVFFLNQNTSRLGKNILAEVKQVVQGLIVSSMQMVAQSVVALFILLMLVVFDPILALAAFILLGGAYGLIYFFSKRKLADIGRKRSIEDERRFKTAGEALSSAKDVKLLGKEAAFIERYARHSQRYSRYMAMQQVIAQLPRYALETVAFGGMLLIALFLLLQGEGAAKLLPTLALYGFASYRLMPALQKIFSSLTSMRFSDAALELIHGDLEVEGSYTYIDRDTLEPLPFKQALELRHVTFAYPGTEKPVLRDFGVTIRPNSSVAFVGATGSGKTTTVDIFLGLLRPQQGGLYVDGVLVDEENLPNWQKNIGYVPQQIYLSDDTVASNIAFGVLKKKIDRAAVEQAARLANIHDFIVNELPQGYETVVGERGIRLSGGQRQRLGIARALYGDPKVLVLDEATSALDGITEEAIFQAVSELGKSKTVIMIAHRMTTVRACDVIYLLERGRIVDQGSFEDLLARNPSFRAMAQVEPAQAV